jgi:hypothetical protein
MHEIQNMLIGEEHLHMSFFILKPDLAISLTKIWKTDIIFSVLEVLLSWQHYI